MYKKLTQVKGQFVLVTVFYLHLQQLWEVNLYMPFYQRTLKMFLTYKQVISLRTLIQKGKASEANRSRVGGDRSMTAICDASLDRSRDRSNTSLRSLNRNNRSIAGQVSRMDVSKLSANRSRLDVSRGDNSRDMTPDLSKVQFNLRNLRKFDRISGGFRDKDFTEEYSEQKTLAFLQRRSSHSTIREPLHNSKTPKKAVKRQKPKLETNNNDLFDNPYLRSYFKQAPSLRDEEFSVPNLDEHAELQPLQDLPHVFHSLPLT